MIEQLQNGQWIKLEDAIATHIRENHYSISIINVPPWIHLKGMDGASLRIDGKETYNVYGKSKRGNVLILEALVHVIS